VIEQLLVVSIVLGKLGLVLVVLLIDCLVVLLQLLRILGNTILDLGCLLLSSSDVVCKLLHFLLVRCKACLGCSIGLATVSLDLRQQLIVGLLESGSLLLSSSSALVSSFLCLCSMSLVLGQVDIGLCRCLSSILIELFLGLAQLLCLLGGLALDLGPVLLDLGRFLGSLGSLGSLRSFTLLNESSTMEIPAMCRSLPLHATNIRSLWGCGSVWETRCKAVHHHLHHVTDGASTLVGLEAASGAGILVLRHVLNLLLPHRDVALEARVLGVWAIAGHSEPQVEELLRLLATSVLGGFHPVFLKQRSALVICLALGLLCQALFGGLWSDRSRRRGDARPGHATVWLGCRSSLAAGHEVSTEEWATDVVGGFALSVLEALATFADRELLGRKLGSLLLSLELVSSLLLEGLLLSSLGISISLHDVSNLLLGEVNFVSLLGLSFLCILLLPTSSLENLLRSLPLLSICLLSSLLGCRLLGSSLGESTLLLLVELLVLLLVGGDGSSSDCSSIIVLLGGLGLLSSILVLLGIEFRKVLLVLISKLVCCSFVVVVDCLVVLLQLLGSLCSCISDLLGLLLAIGNTLCELRHLLLVRGQALLASLLGSTRLLSDLGLEGLDLLLEGL